MIVNDGMTIWILAALMMAFLALAGWRQGAIRAGVNFIGILFAALLAVPLGHLVHPLLVHADSASPITPWALSPVFGFIIAMIPFFVGAQMLHNRVEHFYKYKAGDLKLALWERLNTRLGICIGVFNGAAYFVLISFFLFNLTYWTTQVASAESNQPAMIRLVNKVGEDMQSTGFSKTAAAVGKLPRLYYRLGDLAGLLMQNPDLGPRLAAYPGFASLWHKKELLTLVTDPIVTNALATGATLGEIANSPSVQSVFASKDQTKLLLEAVTNNLDDLTTYLNTGHSPKYDGEPITGDWAFNSPVSLAWLKQMQPKMPNNEMNAVRALLNQSFSQTTLQFTVDSQIYARNWPKFVTQPQANQPLYQAVDCSGDWTRDGANYTLHLVVDGQDKYYTATTDGVRLKIKDSSRLLIFDITD